MMTLPSSAYAGVHISLLWQVRRGHDISTSHMLMKIFFSRCQSPTDMTLRLIDIKNFPCLLGKRRIHLHKALGDVFMYRTLANPKMFRSLTHSGVIVNNISGNLHGSFFNITFQKNPLQCLLLHCMQGIFVYTISYNYSSSLFTSSTKSSNRISPKPCLSASPSLFLTDTRALFCSFSPIIII